MSEVFFYHLQKSALEQVLPDLLVYKVHCHQGERLQAPVGGRPHGRRTRQMEGSPHASSRTG